MIIVKDKKNCCGCHGCMNACPKNAITMEEDEKGFKYPVVDKEKCINCGLCSKVCPIINNELEVKKEFAAYACINKDDEERFNSSSGGIFILLAREIISRNGVVFGAMFDDNFDVKHFYIENANDLYKFMGSKYVQSTIGDSYKKVKEFLEEEKFVLFTGTPCQIEGLKKFLRKDYDKLYTQDFVCHGVPSPKLWKKYLEYQKQSNGERIRSISFRNKDYGWSLFRMKVLFENGTYSKSHKEDLFMKAFLSNICLRDSCYNCSFKKVYRNSDITLGDYWKIEDIHSGYNDDKGVSIVMINSKKGNELFDSIKENIKFTSTNIEEAIKYNSAMIKSAPRHDNEKKFWNHVDIYDFNKLVNKYTHKPNIIVKCKNYAKKYIKHFLKK